MKERTLTSAEIDRLAAAGVKYPWTPWQSLQLLDQLDAAKKTVRAAAWGYCPQCKSDTDHDFLEERVRCRLCGDVHRHMWGVHYDALPHGSCPDPEHCDCECDACRKQRPED